MYDKPGLSLLCQHGLGLLVCTESHGTFLFVAQLAAQELRAAAQGGSNKLVAQQTTVWAQNIIQVGAQICSTPLRLYLRAATDKLNVLSTA